MLKDFLAMIYPDFCVACESSLVKGETQICTNCLYELPHTDFHLVENNGLMQKFRANIPIKYALSYLKFIKNSRVQNILHSLKYEGNQEVGELLGKWYGNVLKENALHHEFDLIIPIPLHPSKLRKRGYNQSDCFAKGLSETMQVKWSNQVVTRTKATDTQTRKNRLERWSNVANIFQIINADLIANQRVLLVDDVITTGSTVESCLIVLQNAGAKELSIGAIAVAQ